VIDLLLIIIEKLISFLFFNCSQRYLYLFFVFQIRMKAIQILPVVLCIIVHTAVGECTAYVYTPDRGGCINNAYIHVFGTIIRINDFFTN
jgi:hypothetical protein